MLCACGGGGTIGHITNHVAWLQQLNSALLSQNLLTMLIMLLIFFALHLNTSLSLQPDVQERLKETIVVSTVMPFIARIYVIPQNTIMHHGNKNQQWVSQG